MPACGVGGDETMRPGTLTWVHEAKLGLQGVKRNFTACNTVTSHDCRTLCDAVELAAKAVYVEQHGETPGPPHHHRLVEICQATTLWPSLPSHLQAFVTAVASYTPSVKYPDEQAYATLAAGGKDWKTRIAEAEEFIGFVEGNLSVASSGPSP
jgi:hypothetical protein